MATTGTVLLDVAVILLAARVGGALFEHVGQPAVIGEIGAGIVLGPTLLGALPGDPSGALFPDSAMAVVALIGDLGLILFMFNVGWRLDLRLVRDRARAAVLISVGSIVLPFTLGLALAAHLYPAHRFVDGTRVPFVAFALFVGAALSVTAFPVLARILEDLRLARTAFGALGLSAAAVDDVLGWTLLAVALAVLGSAGAWDYVLIVGGAVAFVAAVRLLVRPMLRVVVRAGRPGGEALVVATVLAGAYATDLIGIHPVFGAFAVGVAMPRGDSGESAEYVRGGLAWGVRLLAPVFFVGAGIAVDVPGLAADDLTALLLIIAAACAGKFAGAFIGARAARLDPREAAGIAVLMNTRGLVEIVLLTVGRDRGLIDDRLFTLFALMAIVTTLLTTPLLRAIIPLSPERLGGRPVPAS